jgi:deglycase
MADDEKRMAVLAADAFQDSEYFLPKVAIEKMGVHTEVVSIGTDPIEIYSFFDRIGYLEVQRKIDQANPDDYIGVLIPGGAKSPAILAESVEVLRFVRAIDGAGKLVASICRGSLLVAKSGIAKGRRITGFHLEDQFPDLVIRPVVEACGGIWVEDQPAVVDRNLISSRHPDDAPQFTAAIKMWIDDNSRSSARTSDR